MEVETVGVAQLRRDLSAYLRRIEKGERFVVTDRNREVAQLGPVPRDVREELIASGRLLPGDGGAGTIEPATLPGSSRALSAALGEARAE